MGPLIIVAKTECSTQLATICGPSPCVMQHLSKRLIAIGSPALIVGGAALFVYANQCTRGSRRDKYFLIRATVLFRHGGGHNCNRGASWLGFWSWKTSEKSSAAWCEGFKRRA